MSCGCVYDAVANAFTVTQGAVFAETLFFTDASGNPLNLTGCHARMQGRTYDTDPITIFDLSDASGTIDVSGNAVSFSVPATQTINYEPSLANPPGFEPNDILRWLGFYTVIVQESNGGPVVATQTGGLMLQMSFSALP